MERAPIRVGLIGAGGVAGVHIVGYRDHKDVVTLAAVADPVAESAESRAAEFDASVYTDYRTMLAEADIDAVDICLPHHLHKDAIVAAARAGKHILCEKPLVMSMEEAEEIYAAVSEAGVTLMCAHNHLFLPSVQKAKQLLDEGFLGTVYQVRSTCSFLNEFTAESMGWRADTKQAGGGELIDTGYHPTYVLMYLVGANPVEVSAVLSTHRLKFQEAEDTAELLVRFDNDVVGSVSTSWAYTAPGGERFAIVGERGTLSGNATSLTYTLNGEDPVTIEFEPVHHFSAEIGHFGQSLIDGVKPIQNEEDGVAVLGVILAAYESVEKKITAPVRRPSFALA